MSPTREQFTSALWEAYQQAKFPGLEWKFIEWVRDPCVKKLGITRAEFNNLLERALEDSDENRIPWDIIADSEVGHIRRQQVTRMTPVVVNGHRVYVIAMRPRPSEDPVGSSVKAGE